MEKKHNFLLFEHEHALTHTHITNIKNKHTRATQMRNKMKFGRWEMRGERVKKGMKLECDFMFTVFSVLLLLSSHIFTRFGIEEPFQCQAPTLKSTIYAYNCFLFMFSSIPIAIIVQTKLISFDWIDCVSHLNLQFLHSFKNPPFNYLLTSMWLLFATIQTVDEFSPL